MSLELGYHPLGENYGYYIDKAPQNVLEELKIQIDKLQFDFSKGKKHNNYLAGEIEHEYKIRPQLQTKQYIKDLTQRFENESQYMVLNYTPLPTLNFSDLWINFQKKHEYNPMHSHSGIYSFVIWYQIPYLNEDETGKFGFKPNPQKVNHGQFHFLIPSGKDIIINPLNIDKSKEGYVAIFPSNLNHIVYPFYSSDGYRITVAGNIRPHDDSLR